MMMNSKTLIVAFAALALVAMPVTATNSDHIPEDALEKFSRNEHFARHFAEPDEQLELEPEASNAGLFVGIACAVVSILLCVGLCVCACAYCTPVRRDMHGYQPVDGFNNLYKGNSDNKVVYMPHHLKSYEQQGPQVHHPTRLAARAGHMDGGDFVANRMFQTKVARPLYTKKQQHPEGGDHLHQNTILQNQHPINVLPTQHHQIPLTHTVNQQDDYAYY